MIRPIIETEIFDEKHCFLYHLKQLTDDELERRAAELPEQIVKISLESDQLLGFEEVAILEEVLERWLKNRRAGG